MESSMKWHFDTVIKAWIENWCSHAGDNECDDSKTGTSFVFSKQARISEYPERNNWVDRMISSSQLWEESLLMNSYSTETIVAFYLSAMRSSLWVREGGGYEATQSYYCFHTIIWGGNSAVKTVTENYMLGDMERKKWSISRRDSRRL